MKKYFSKITLLFLLLLIPATKFLFIPNEYWNMHDDMQLVRQLEMEKCLKDGQIPCRWVPDLGYGYGYPLFNFYPPMPYYVGQIYRTFGISYTNTVKITAATQFLLAAITMYILASSLFGPLGGLVSALFYTYAPYHAVNIYIRGAMNEAWAAVFFPLIFYFSKELVEKPKIKNLVGLSLALSGLMLSHNPMLLIFSPVVTVWCLFWIYQKKTTPVSANLFPIIKLALAVFLSLGLAAYYTFPVILESKFVQIGSMFTNYYSYSIHFISLKQLFISNFWGEGPSVWGPKDGFSLSVGYLHWLIPFAVTAYIVVKKLFKKPITVIEQMIVLTSLMGLFAIFMAHERSTFIWKIFTTIQKIQFPWRFLNISTFLVSFSAGIIGVIFQKSKYSKLIVGGIISLLLIINIPFFTPVSHGPVTDAQKFSGLAWRNQVTGGIYDYLPNTAGTAAKGPAKDYIDDVVPSTVKYSLSGQQKGTDWQFYNLKLDAPAKVYLAQLDFPQFNVYVNGKLVPHQVEPEFGRISLDLNAGENQIYFKLQNTPIRTLSNIVSILSVLLVIFLVRKWNKSI